MDNHNTKPHVSTRRGTKFKSSMHQASYMYDANLDVAMWQAMYSKGVPNGSKGYVFFIIESRGNKQT